MVAGVVAIGRGFLAALRLVDEHPMAAIVGASAVAYGVVGIVAAGRLGVMADSVVPPAEQPSAAVRLMALWGRRRRDESLLLAWIPAQWPESAGVSLIARSSLAPRPMGRGDRALPPPA